MKAQDKHLVGRTIVAVEWEDFVDNVGSPEREPRLVLDDGRRVYFCVRELDGDYGVTAHVTRKVKP